eukprot:Skav215014  [mRNA]  locus=scaffold966:60640:61326:+ [translate_table: standard]
MRRIRGPGRIPDLELPCKITGTQVTYQCSAGSGTEPVPQLPSFRVDCEGATMQNLTLFQTSQQCHRMSYRLISNSTGRPRATRVAFVSDHAVTLEKGDVLDLQCIMRPFNFNERLAVRGHGYLVDFKMVLNGHAEVKWYRAVQPIHFLMTSRPETMTACETYVGEKYDWNMELVKSVNSTRHVVRYSSPLLELKSDLFPKMDAGDNVVQSGTLFQASMQEKWDLLLES